MTEYETTTVETFIDPICGMHVKPANAAGSLNQDGETYYFCSTACLQKFMAPNDVNSASCCGGN
ncbi:MAG: YHS domain-containing protein [Blastocatellia bacterium]|nr:YHS domain-containing protein [Blastocatellia bacterium]